jgi:hypothetical protein
MVVSLNLLMHLKTMCITAETVGFTTTRSPFLYFVTSFPTSSTIPENSCPKDPTVSAREKEENVDLYDGYTFIGLGSDGGFAEFTNAPEDNVYLHFLLFHVQKQLGLQRHGRLFYIL